MRDVRISDVTMRRAAKTKALNLTFKKKLELAKLLDRLGVSVIEIEGIASPKADALRIKSIASIVKNSVLCVPVEFDQENIKAVWAALADANKPRLQIHAAVSPAQMEYIHHKKADGMKEAVSQAIKAAAALCPDVEFVADDAMRADATYLREIITLAIESGATTITVCDATGKSLPEEFRANIEQLRSEIPTLDDVTLGISCSDELYMANACAVAGIMAGAGEVKASSYPLGCAFTGKVAKILADKEDVIDATIGVHHTELKRATSQITLICESAESLGLDDDISSQGETVISLDANDSIETVTAATSQLGYELSLEDSAAVYEAFKHIAEKKESIDARELDAIIANVAMQVPPTYVLENHSYNAGSECRATAYVKVSMGNETIEKVGMGDGPIGAAYAALEEIAGRNVELESFQIRAITEGPDALGESIVKLASNGRMYSGRGISTDIVGASIRAYVNALNKIAFEEAN